MTLDELSTSWNDLRNAALGRGVKPNVPKKLAKEVERDYSRWRKAREEFSFDQGITTSTDVLGSVVMRDWVATYRKLCKKVAAAGVDCEQPPPTTLEKALQGIDRFNRNVAIGLGVGGAVTLAWFLVRGSRNE